MLYSQSCMQRVIFRFPEEVEQEPVYHLALVWAVLDSGVRMKLAMRHLAALSPRVSKRQASYQPSEAAQLVEHHQFWSLSAVVDMSITGTRLHRPSERTCLSRLKTASRATR